MYDISSYASDKAAGHNVLCVCEGGDYKVVATPVNHMGEPMSPLTVCVQIDALAAEIARLRGMAEDLETLYNDLLAATVLT